MKTSAKPAAIWMRLRRSTVRHLLAASAVALLFGACAGGGNRASSPPGRYSHSLHDRFYEAWVQPEMVGAPRGKVSVPVDVRIAANGRVLSFQIVNSSGYPRIDASIRAVGRRVRKVAPPPLTSGEFKLRINFDLDVKR